MLEKCHLLLVKIKLLQQTSLTLSLNTINVELNNLGLQLTIVIDKLKQVKDPQDDKECEHQYHDINKSVRQLLKIIAETKKGSDVLYAEIGNQLYQAIEAGNIGRVVELLKTGERLFEHGIAINEMNTAHGSFLAFAAEKNQPAIAGVLLEYGANPNLSMFGKKSPLTLAIKNQCIPTMTLLFEHGVKIDEKSLFEAIKTGNLAIVKILVDKGASLEPNRGTLLSGKTKHFNSPLKYALQRNELEIAQFLFDEVNKNTQLWRNNLNHFLHNAPLDLLKRFLSDHSRSSSVKLATMLVTRINIEKNAAMCSSGEILLKRLLKRTTEPAKRLAVLKMFIQQLMTVKYLPTSLETESCYADRELIESLTHLTNNSPIKDLACSLFNSMQTASQQGCVVAGYRVLLEAVSFAANNNSLFLPGVELINQVTTALHHDHKTNKSWSSIDKVNCIIEEETKKIEITLVDTPEDEVESSVSYERASRFQAMVGGSIFTKFNPHLPSGGDSSKAGRWYKNIVAILVQTMNDSKLLSDDWNEAKALQLLEGVCKNAASFVSISDNSSEPQAVGFNLRMPDHFIPAVLYKDAANWKYTVVCRSFLQPQDQSNRGAVECIIPFKFTNQALLLIKETIKRRSNEYVESQSAGIREIEYRLLKHFLAIEKLTSVPCTYSNACTQKPYKISTCFASNIKPLLQLFVTVMAKTTVTEEQWQQYNEKIKTLILKEMSKANASLDQFKQEEQAYSGKKYSEQQKAYKLLSILSRWIEINHFEPQIEEEKRGKDATLEHVGAHTRCFFS